jgi:hypothetical protein
LEGSEGIRIPGEINNILIPKNPLSGQKPFEGSNPSLAAARAAENEKLRQENQQLKAERTHYCERAVLLEEELRWLKAHYFGASSQKSDAALASADQGLLFNEAEVLAAIEAAEQAHRARTTKVGAHERPHSGGRKAIPEHFPRIRIEHDLPEAQKLCSCCSTPHPLRRMGHEVRECYRFEPPKISVEQHIRWTYVCEERHESPVTAPAPPTTSEWRTQAEGGVNGTGSSPPTASNTKSWYSNSPSRTDSDTFETRDLEPPLVPAVQGVRSD